VLDGADMRRAVLATAHEGFQLIRVNGAAASLNGTDLSEAEVGKVEFFKLLPQGRPAPGSQPAGRRLRRRDHDRR